MLTEPPDLACVRLAVPLKIGGVVCMVSTRRASKPMLVRDTPVDKILAHDLLTAQKINLTVSIHHHLARINRFSAFSLLVFVSRIDLLIHDESVQLALG